MSGSLITLKQTPVEKNMQKYNHITIYSKAKASVPGASNKLGEWETKYEIFLHGLAQQWRPQKIEICHMGSL